MFEGVEEHFRKLAEISEAAIPEDWTRFCIESEHYDGFSQQYCEYYRKSDGKERTFDSNHLTGCILELRSLFQKADKPLGGRFVFEVHEDGKFNLDFDYENCTESAHLVYDEEKFDEKFNAWVQRHKNAVGFSQ